MAALQALLDDRMQSPAEERSAKQASRARLVADPLITVTSLVAVFTSFVNRKGKKNLWPNAKIQSGRLVKALKTMRLPRDLELNAAPPVSNQGSMDKLDFTIRVLMPQLRSLKASASLQVKVFRAL